MTVVDTTVWIDYLRGNATEAARWLEAELERQRLALTDLNLCELLQGASNEREAQELRRDLERFAILPTGGIELAVSAAQNYRTLRSKGVTVRKTIDCLIATFCIQNGHSLLHNDRDFDPFEQFLELQVIHP